MIAGILLSAMQVAADVDAGPAIVSRVAAVPTLTLKPADMLALAERAKSNSDDRVVEAIYAALATDPNPDVRAEARFRQAMRLAKLNRTRDAAVLLRRVLDDKPGAAPVRLELATLFQKLGDEEAGLRELRALRSADLPPAVTRFVDRLAASLRASKPFSLQVEVALAPDSNVNHATRSDTLGTVFGDFTLARDAKAKSGIGAAVRTSTQARLRISDTLHLVTRLSAEASLYRDKEFNDVGAELSSGPELMVGRTRLGLEAGVGQQWYGMRPYQRSLRVSGSATRPVDPVSQLRVDASARWTDNHANALQGGHGISFRTRYERALSPRMIVSANLGIDRYKAGDDAFSTRSWSAGVSAYRDVGRMSFSAGLQIGRLAADDRLALLPEARQDKSTRWSFGAVFRQLTVAGFAPMTRLTIERNRSSVIFYDFTRTRTEIGVSRAF
jgi:hypothetical protein